MMTLAESMAMAVLKGDMVAAYALADRLLEQRADPNSLMEEAARIRSERRPGAQDGYSVYHWPEFQAFARRAGILVDLRTIRISFTLHEGEVFTVEHVYQATDHEPPVTVTKELGG